MRKAIFEDDQSDIGVPMLLHTAASLAQDPDPGRFGTAGYLHQAALGRRLLETGDLDGEQGAAPLLSLNFHAIPPDCRPEAENRIRRATTLGEPFDPDGPDDGVDGLRVMVAFYDADRDTGLFADRLCRELGVRAYFFPVEVTSLETGPRLTDDDLTSIAEHHELCFHTATHRSAREITPGNSATEVTAPVERLTRAAGRPPRLAAWRGGARFHAGTLGDQMLRDLGVRHLVSNWSIEPVG
jgi:Polysaccharide deacetylase